jgi:hypothetical protein
MKMTQYVPYGPPASTTDTLSAAGLLAVPLALAALFFAVSHPAYAAAIAVGLLTLKSGQVGLAAAVRRARDRVREFTVPGVCTVRFRVTPR